MIGKESWACVEKTDPEIAKAIEGEAKRQERVLEMIPSENYASKAVLEATGSVFANKYAEGYPKKRYYQGNEFVDPLETIAIERAKKLFGAEHANVQPNSGSPANMAVFFAMLSPGDKILAMDLAHGGHLTHGSAINFSGKLYSFFHYGVDPKTERIDYDKVREIAEREKPRLIISGFTAYPRETDFKKFHSIAESVGAYSMADISHIAGLVVGGVHQSPLPFTDIVTTTTHKTLRGPRGAIILCKEKFGKAIDKAVFPGLQGGPHENSIAAKAVAFKEASSPEFSEYARQIVRNAKALSDTLSAEGVRLVSGGTDTHLILADLSTTEGIGVPSMGKPVAEALESAGIVCNANTVPFDKGTPFKPSGLRFGTPALTTKGMKESEMKEVGRLIAKVIGAHSDETTIASVRKRAEELSTAFPAYPS